MPARVRLAIMAGSLLVLLGLLVLVAFGPRPGPAEEPGLRGAVAPEGQPPVDFVLRTQDGERFDARSLHGSPAIVTFLYTTCEDACPTVAQQIRGALDIAGKDVPTVAIAVDPPRDTPLRARRFLAEQRLTGRMQFLLGSRSELQRVWRRFGVQPQEDGIDHSARVVLLGADGRPAVVWPVDQVTPEALAHDLRLLIGRSGR